MDMHEFQFQSPLLGAVPSPRKFEVTEKVFNVSIPSSGGSAFTRKFAGFFHEKMSFNPLFWGQCLHPRSQFVALAYELVSIPSSGGSAFTGGRIQSGRCSR